MSNSYSWWLNSELRTYDDAARYFSKARQPDKGRPLKSWARLFKVGDNYVVRIEATDVAVFTPDNKLTMVLGMDDLSCYAQTLSSSMHRAIPIAVLRVGKGRYRVQHTKAIDDIRNKGGSPASAWAILRTSPELFTGMTFDLATGQALNARKDLKDCVIPDKRLEWVRKLRKFKQGIKVRAKLGVFDTLAKEVHAERMAAGGPSAWRRPDWSDALWVDALYNAIKDEQFPMELMRGFVASASISWWRPTTPTTQDVLKESENILNNLSINLRTRFGVFDIDQSKVA